MSTLSTHTSNLSDSTYEKKAEEGLGRVVPVLADIAEDEDVDEGAEVAGTVANEVAPEESAAVRRKLDRRVSWVSNSSSRLGS